MSRRTRTTIPTAEALLKPEVVEGVHDNINRKRQQTKATYDKSARPLPELQIGEPVRLQPVNPKAPWDKGSCVAKVGPRSYLIETDNPNLHRRNRKLIRQDPSQGHQSPSSLIAAPPSRAHLWQSLQMSTLNLQRKKKGNRSNLRLSLQEVAESAFAHQDSQTTFNRRFMN